MKMTVWDTYDMDVLTSSVDGIKSDRLGYVKGYLVRFGDTKTADLEGDYFTKATDYGFPMTRLCFSLKDPHIPPPRLCLLHEEWAGLSDREVHQSERGAYTIGTLSGAQ